MKVTVRFYKSEKLIFSRDIDIKKYTLADLKNDIAVKVGVHKNRIGVKATKRGKLITLQQGSTLSDIPFDEPDNVNLFFVDLGPQIGFRTLFILEYLSALIPYSVIYMLSEKHQLGSSNEGILSKTRLAALCWNFHFIKRIYESIYVHKFSKDTMPVMNAMRNIIYYGGFSIFIGYFVNYYFSSLTAADVIASLFFFFFAYCNWYCHDLVAGLRESDGDISRPVPKPNGFNPTLLYHFVSFPNYFYEILTWISFTILTRSLASGLFTICGAIIMSKWGKKKHNRYKEDPGYPKNRKAIIPYII